MITQEIRYHMPEAGEVYLVWGVNGWQSVPEKIQPPGTTVDVVMFTPMVLQGDTFVAKVQVYAGTTLDYGFQTRKKRDGTPTKEWVWDGDYQLTPGDDPVVEIEATVTLDSQPSNSPAESSLVTQEFRYHMPEAGEVYFVWGIDGWQNVPEEIRPPKTTVDGVMFTPMEVVGDAFVVKVQVPAGTTLDYGFQTRKKRSGTPIGYVWDGDYHLVSFSNEIIEKQSTVSLAGATEFSSDFTMGLPILIVVSLMLGIVLIAKSRLQRDKWSAGLSPDGIILGVSLSLIIFLLLIRANILGYGWISWRYSLGYLPDIMAAGYYDLIYVSIIAFLSLTLLQFFRKRSAVQKILVYLYYTVALSSLLIAFFNIQAIQMLGRPFNYQWFYYSDFLKSSESQSAVLANVSSDTLLNIIALSAALIITSHLLLQLTYLLPKFQSRYPLVITLIVPALIYFSAANWYISTLAPHWDYDKLANPITSFVGSIINSSTQPQFFTMELSKDDFQEFSPVEDRPHHIPLPYRTNRQVKNVILFVLESVPAEYVEAYGGTYPVTPQLNKYRQSSLLFKNIYAHAPASNKSLFTLLSSVYPWISYQSLTQQTPEIDLPTLSSELKKNNYRTAFLSAADMSFQRGDEFLSHRQFDNFEDVNGLTCDRQAFDLEWAFSDGIDEECMIDAFSAWQNVKPEDPFFAMMWTVGTHYPYFVVGEETDYGVNDEAFNRYLNALHHSDKTLGRLMDVLKKQDLLETTLVVVVGDHGEAFGRHDQFGHASNIYEENIHVPLMFINSSLFSGQENTTIGGHVDVAPTIMNILDLPIPVEWQGRSLFDHNRSGRTYFFSPWSDVLFGYREGNLKFIFNATVNTTQVYDLSIDTHETTDLTEQMPDLLPRSQHQMAAWIQYHDKFMTKLLEK
ncbi:MAG: sulfatase [Anaerolineae bacterium]|nr:sulfatase [Anaerolineae bacterium]